MRPALLAVDENEMSLRLWVASEALHSGAIAGKLGLQRGGSPLTLVSPCHLFGVIRGESECHKCVARWDQRS